MSSLTIATVLAVLSLGPTAVGANDDPLRVRLQLPAGTHYVGEPLELIVGVVAESQRPKLTIPRSADLEMTFIDHDLQPISASGIGDVVGTTNLFRARYRVIAKRAGNLEIPAITARIDDRAGASKPARLRIQELPAGQRPKEFLGGVGTFDVRAEAEPATVRLGQTLEYRIRLTGPAARTSRVAPVLSRVADLPIRPEVEALEPEAIADPPSRLYRYRLRPTRAGEGTLPPVAVAAFEPRAGRYVTKVTHGVPVRVVAVPSFASGDLHYGASVRAGTARASSPARSLQAYIGVGLVLTALGLLRHVARARSLDIDRARATATRRARELPARELPAEVARWIGEGLVEYLGLTSERAPGALTAVEAAEEIAAVTDDLALAAQARALVELCDRARYGLAGPSSEQLAYEARAVFSALGERPVLGAGLRKAKRGSPDREKG